MHKIVREKEIYRVTWQGSIVNLVLLVFKFAAGIAGHSAAMVADAAHSLSDFITDIIVILFVRISARPEDKSHEYGYGKYETLATVFIGIFLIVVGAGIFIEGVRDIIGYAQGKEGEAPGIIALIAAVVSILFKEFLYRYTIRKGRRLNSPAVVANAWHHRSDALSSIGTAAGIGGAIVLGGGWRVLDPIAAVIVSLFIARVAVRLLRPCFGELLEKSLPEHTEKEIADIILSSHGVDSLHHLRTRRIGNRYAIEVHVLMDGALSLEEAHRNTILIEKRIKEVFGPQTHIGIHMEPRK